MKTQTPLQALAAGVTADWKLPGREMPDCDTTVLVYCPTADSEPIWLGYYDGERWLDINDIATPPVAAWAHLPEPPNSPLPDWPHWPK